MPLCRESAEMHMWWGSHLHFTLGQVQVHAHVHAHVHVYVHVIV